MVKKMKKFDMIYLALHYRQAYNDLPEAYKGDSCLTFFIDVNNNLCAEYPELKQEFIYIQPEKLHDMQESWTRIK